MVVNLRTELLHTCDCVIHGRSAKKVLYNVLNANVSFVKEEI